MLKLTTNLVLRSTSILAGGNLSTNTPGSFLKYSTLPDLSEPGSPRETCNASVMKVVDTLFKSNQEMVFLAAGWTMSHRSVWNSFGEAMAHQKQSGYSLKDIKVKVRRERREPQANRREPWAEMLALAYYLVGPEGSCRLVQKQPIYRGAEAKENICSEIVKRRTEKQMQLYTLGVGWSNSGYLGSIHPGEMSQWMHVVDTGEDPIILVSWSEDSSPVFQSCAREDILKHLQFSDAEPFTFSKFQCRKLPHIDQIDSWLKSQVPPDVSIVDRTLCRLNGSGEHALILPSEPDWKDVASRVQPKVLELFKEIHKFARHPTETSYEIERDRWTRCGFTADEIMKLAIGQTQEAQKLTDSEILTKILANEKVLLNTVQQEGLGSQIALYRFKLDGNIKLPSLDMSLRIDHGFVVVQYLERDKKSPDKSKIGYLLLQSYQGGYRLIDWLEYLKKQGFSPHGSYSGEEFRTEFLEPMKPLFERKDPLAYARNYIKLFCAPQFVELEPHATAEWGDVMNPVTATCFDSFGCDSPEG